MNMPAGEPSYEIECRCGATLRGRRLAQTQIVSCTSCRRPVFILPTSPLPPDLLGSLAGGTAPEMPALKLAPHLRFWFGPMAAALVALSIVGVIIAAIVQRHRSNGSTGLSESAARWQWNARFEAAQAASNEGAYRTAANELAAAAALLQRFPDLAAGAPLRDFRRMRRQVDLLADLLPESIEEIMRHAIGQSAAEWQAIFRQRYAGQAVILDARVWRDSGGQFHVDYQLEAGGLPGEWDVQGLALLHRLPLQTPQRLFIGLRLADVSRTSRDAWAVRPQPDSGVLFTDETLLNGLSIAIDGELRDLLRRQAGWKADE